MANPSKPSWRRAAGRQPAQAAEGKGWQRRKTRVADTSVAGHRIKLTLLGLLVVGLTTAFVLIIILWPRATPMIVMSVSDYATPIPPNAFAQEDVQRLAETNLANIRLAPPSAPKMDRAALLRYLQNSFSTAKAGGPSKNVVLLYLSAHGVVDGSGEPCLLLSDAKPLDATTWFKMRELLDVLKSRPQVRKVLLLDTNRIDDEWSMGVGYNGFTEQFEKLLTESSVPHLYVLHSVAPGQRGWSAPELGGSVFGHFVSQGLQGLASRDNNRITLLELANYVGGEVSRFVREQRQGDQLPRLLTPVTKQQDFPLAYTAGSKQEPPSDAAGNRPQLIARWKLISNRWRQLADAMRDRELLRQDPVGIAQIQQLLLRMERLLLAGKAYESEIATAENEVAVLLDVDARLRPPVEVDGYSLPLRRQLSGAGPLDEQAVATLAAWKKAGGKPPVKKDEPEPPPLKYAAAAEIGWQFLRENERPQLGQLRDVLTLIDDSRGRRDVKAATLPDLSEILFLRMVNRYLDVPPGASDFTDPQRSAFREALATRTLAELAAAPGDERVHYWNQALVNVGDQARRLAEDHLFCDRPVAVSGPNAAPASATYRQAIERGDELSRIYALRDEVWNGLPHLAGWVLRGPDSATGRGLAVSAEILRKDVETLAQRNHELAATLDQSLIDGRLDAAPVPPALVSEVQQAWQELRGSFVGYCQELKERGTRDKATLREMGAVLRVPSPLLDADERDQLATAYVNGLFDRVELPGKPSMPAAAGAAAASAVPTGSAAAPALRAILGAEPTGLHPALQILRRSRFTLLLNRRDRQAELERGGESDLVWLARQGERMRQWLADLDSAAKDLEDDTKSRLKDSVETPANIRAGVSEADRLIRAAMALAPAGVRDSPRWMRAVDRHLQLRWHARRTIDDFWGPPPGQDGAASYFATVATAYLEAARQFEDTPTSPTYDKVDLRELLDGRLAAASGLLVEPRDVRTLGDTPSVSQTTTVHWHQYLPMPGTAAFFFDSQRAGGQLRLLPVTDDDAHAWRRHPLAVANSASVEARQQLPIQELPTSQAGHTLSANLFYRGHLRRRPFELRGPEFELTATVAPQLPPRAKVTVRGAGNRRAYITFIVDCSGSMQTVDNGVKRMDAAKDALFNVLQSLQNNDNYRVGLRAYAHRYRYVSQGGQIVAVDLSGQPINVDGERDPDRDVEILVGIDQLTPEHLNEIRRCAQQLRENGVTPLYYSIIHALLDNDRDFRFADKNDLRHIIVITDGINQEQKKHTSAADVLQVIEREPRAAGKVVDVVLFQEQATLRAKPQGVANVRQELNDIKQIAERTGGHYFAADDPAQLVKALRDALQLLKFSVVPAGQPEASPADSMDLGRFKTFHFPASRLGPYRVLLHGAEGAQGQVVDLQGGEAVELEYDKAGNRLVFPPFQAGDSRPLDRSPIDPVSGDSFRVIPILPRKSLNRVEFQLAIQNTDPLKFTPRPEHVWAEITPLDGGGRPLRAQPHVFYDTQFVVDRPVPVLQFVVDDWPAGSTQAAMKAWFKFSTPPLKPNGEASIQSLQRIVIPEDIEHAAFAAEIKQIGEGTEGWRVTVAERHDPGTELFTARVQSLPAANLVRHRFYVGLGEARHEFEYDRRPAPTVVITSLVKLRESAIEVPRFVLQVKE